MRNSIEPAVWQEIDRRLEVIAADEGVRLILAVESGSRAWGFPSPDSDYDVRFIYVRQLESYLTLKERRDVIERPIVDEIDLSGWDLKKALNLLLKSNAVVSEWLESPVVYRKDEAKVVALKKLADRAMTPIALTHHYLRLAKRQYTRSIEPHSEVELKKYFYVLRPVLALRCLRSNAGSRVPMNIFELIDRANVDDCVAERINELVVRKAATHELGTGPRLSELDALIAMEMADASERVARLGGRSGLLLDEAETFFRNVVRE